MNTTENHIEPLAVPVKTGCRIGGFGITTAYKLMYEGKLETVKIGRRRLILYASLKGLLAPAPRSTSDAA